MRSSLDRVGAGAAWSGEGMLASPWLGKRAPTEGDASIPSPLHAAPAPTRLDASEDAAHGHA